MCVLVPRAERVALQDGELLLHEVCSDRALMYGWGSLEA